MKFKCKLLSDIILSQDSSTEGNQSSLDFIPGNNFLGIVSASIYNSVQALDVFHSGKVRFGDANPGKEMFRGLKVPNAMFHPKQKKPSEECYIHHLVENPNDEAVKNLQLKQCRTGFYVFENNEGTPVEIRKNFAIKSKYDSEKRRSEDEMLFGYQSLIEGLTLYFDIESDLDSATNEKIAEAISGIKHIGHSRTAQYGLVKIEREDYKEVESSGNTTILDGKKYAAVYADGRLIFLDESGEPTFRPSAKDLGFREGDKIDWSKSQVRTFQYSPWNGKRHTYDTDRCGIEKGSVFVVECAESPSESAYVGNYRNEGFGKVIYNPDFLGGDANGIAKYTLKEAEKTPDPKRSDVSADTPLLKYLKRQKKKDEGAKSIYERVNEFVDKYASRFKGEQFASQWSYIRSIAMITSDESKIEKAVMEFLSHGIAKRKWEERGRLKALEDFIKETKSNIRETLINLASQMSKVCRKEGNK